MITLIASAHDELDGDSIAAIAVQAPTYEEAKKKAMAGFEEWGNFSEYTTYKFQVLPVSFEGVLYLSTFTR